MRQLHAHVINMTNTIYSQGELAVLNAHKGLPLIFYLLLNGLAEVFFQSFYVGSTIHGQVF